MRHLNTLGARIRLVKGAYKEPPDAAWQLKADVDAAYIRLMEVLLREGRFPALATHDPAIIAAEVLKEMVETGCSSLYDRLGGFAAFRVTRSRMLRSLRARAWRSAAVVPDPNSWSNTSRGSRIICSGCVGDAQLIVSV